MINVGNLINNNHQSSNNIENQRNKFLNNKIKNENITKYETKYLNNISVNTQNKDYNNISLPIIKNNNIESNNKNYENGKNEITLNNNNFFYKKGLIMNEIKQEKENEIDNTKENEKSNKIIENNVKNTNLINIDNNINKTNSPSKTEINNELQTKFLLFLSEIKKSSFSKPFKKPPLELIHDKNLKNKYKETIEKPIDLNIVSKKLKNNEYQNVKSFIDDVFLIFNNAMLFNKENSKIYKYAKSLKIKSKLKFEDMKFLPISGLVRNLKINQKKSKNKTKGIIQQNVFNQYNNNEDNNFNKMNYNNKENNNNKKGKLKLLNKKKLRYKINFERHISSQNLRKNDKIKNNQNRKKFNREKQLNIQNKNNNKKKVSKENKGTNTIVENQFSQNILSHENEKIIISKKISELSDNEIIDVLTYLTHTCNVLTNINEKLKDCIIIDFDKFSDENYKSLIKYLEDIEEKRNLLSKNNSEDNFNISEYFEP